MSTIKHRYLSNHSNHYRLDLLLFLHKLKVIDYLDPVYPNLGGLDRRFPPPISLGSRVIDEVTYEWVMFEIYDKGIV